MKFQRKLLLAFTGMALFPTIILVLVAYHLISQSIEHWADYKIAATLENAKKLAYQLELHENQPLTFTAEELALDPDLVAALETPADSSLINQRMTELADAYQEYILALYDQSGQAIYRTHPDIPPTNLTDFLYPLDELPEDPTTSEELKHEGVLISGMPVFSEDGTSRLGAIVIGKLIPLTTAQARDQLATIQDRVDALTTNIGALATGIDEDQTEYRRTEKRLTFIALLITAAVVIALSFWLSRILAKGINTPIQSIVKGTEEIVDGNLDYEVKVQSKDEFAVLARAFNQMVGDLRRRTEELKRAEKIAAWQEIAQKLAHEIKNPLTPIQLSAQRLHRRYHNNPGEYAELLEQCTQTIITAVEGLRHLLDEFSQLARLPAPELSSLKLDEVIEATIDIFGEFPPHVEVRMEVPSDLPPVVGDAEHLKRAFLNLIKNGLEAMDDMEKGMLTIRTFPSLDKSRVYVHFTDTGRGIPPEVREKIFTPHVSTKRDGMGLGLAIVKKIMTDLGGDIHLEDAQPGQPGTTFVLWLRASATNRT